MTTKCKITAGFAIVVLLVVLSSVAAQAITLNALAKSGGQELPSVTFPHDQHTTALRAVHKDCATCHKPSDAKGQGRPFSFMGSDAVTGTALKNLYHDNCIGCHNEMRKAGRPTGPLMAQCRSCHSGQAQPAWQKPVWTDAIHDSHIASKLIVAPGQNDNCAACHHVYNAEKKALVYESGKEAACNTCHLTQAKQKAALAADPKATDANGPIAGRLTLDQASHQACVKCHMDIAAKNPGAKNGPTDCAGCHGAKAPAAAAAQTNASGQTAPPAASKPGHGQTGVSMASLYSFLTGPAFVASLLIFVCGMIMRLVLYFNGLDWRLDRVGYRPNMSRGMKAGLYSIIKWLVPYGTHGWRQYPLFALGFLLLHVGAVLLPLFLIGHNVILQQNFGFSLPTLPQPLATVLTVLTLLGITMLVLRRIALPQVRILTTWHDYLVLALVFLPFLTGLLASLHVEDYNFWVICHILFGELLLILAPFTKLSHIALYFGSRWQIGADFGIKRGDRSRGTCFPW